MTIVGNIGLGLLILLVLWIATIFVFVFSIKVQSNFAWIALGVSTIITIVLLSLPTERTSKSPQTSTADNDYVSLKVHLVFTFLLISLIGGTFAFIISRIFESRLQPLPFKSINAD